MEQGARVIIRDHEEKLKRSREHRKMKKEQSKLVKRSKCRKIEGSRENREHRPPLTEPHYHGNDKMITP